MIQNLRHRGLKRLYERGDRSKVPPALVETIEEALTFLDIAQSSKDMDVPGYRLHKLKGKFNGFWSISISGNWRIIFRLDRGHVYDVDLLDYH